MTPSPAGRPTIADVAKSAGVSRTTVSHALAGKGRVDPATRERVLRAAADLAYRPSPRAQRLRGGSARSVAILSALPPSIVGEGSEMGFLLDMAMPAARACLSYGYSLVLVPPGAGSGYLDGLDIDGAIVIDPLVDDPSCAALESRGVRVVTIGRAQGARADAILDRGMAGSDVMLDHLVDRGARCIAVVRSAEAYGAASVLEGLALANGGRWRDAEVIVVAADAAGGERAAHHAIAELLRERPEVDAIYAPLDAFALGALSAARDRGRVIGGDLLVATNYDGPRAAGSAPPLTVLALGLDAMAQTAADVLIRALAGEEVQDVVVERPTVIPRASTARLASTS